MTISTNLYIYNMHNTYVMSSQTIGSAGFPVCGDQSPSESLSDAGRAVSCCDGRDRPLTFSRLVC